MVLHYKSKDNKNTKLNYMYPPLSNCVYQCYILGIIKIGDECLLHGKVRHIHIHDIGLQGVFAKLMQMTLITF